MALKLLPLCNNDAIAAQPAPRGKPDPLRFVMIVIRL
jgi:hypothetical protein